MPQNDHSLLVLCQNSSFLLYKTDEELLKITVEEFFTMYKLIPAGQSYENFVISSSSSLHNSSLLKIIIASKNYIKDSIEFILVNFDIYSENFSIEVTFTVD